MGSVTTKIVIGACFIGIVFLMFLGCQDKKEKTGSDIRATRQKIVAEIDSVLNNEYGLWYPRVVDTEYSGFLSRFSFDWHKEGDQKKFIVTQARHVWASSIISNTDKNHQNFKKYAKHGFKFLKDKMWDQQYGGFYNMVSRQGNPVMNEDKRMQKKLYGNAFAIYGLAAYYKVSNSEKAIDLAKKTFKWLDRGSYDHENGGYFNSLTRAGSPDETGFAKDYNSGIHILEALAELYKVWPDSLVRNRLYGMFRAVRDTMVTNQGYLNLYFKNDWTPIVYQDSSRELQEANQDVDHITFGHDIETAFLLLESAQSLGFPADSTLSVAKKLVDHTIEHAWDKEDGGIYNYGYNFQGDDSLTITNSSKEWWSQIEALHSLLIMADYFPKDAHHYFDLFVKQWEYIKKYMLDHEHGGWYRNGIDEDPEAKKAPKATIWKGNYHTVRGLLRCRELLKKMGNDNNTK